MAEDSDKTTEAAEEQGSAAELEGGSYEVIAARLVEQAKELGRRTEALNERRQAVFGGTELAVVANERVRTENNCTPRDIVQVGGRLVFGYNVFLGLRTETALSDVFSLHKFEPKEDGSVDLSAIPLEEGGAGFLADPTFVEHFHELYRFYKEARLIQLSRSETKLLAVWQIGGELTDVRVARWTLAPDDSARYVDNRGERDYEFPPQHDFEWTVLTREDQISGDYPHMSIRDKVFVETTGGDLTVKVENNTASGKGIYAEPVDDQYQTLDDAQFQYREVGPLIIMRILPYREERWRYLVFCSRTEKVVRIDAIGKACRSLPEDHGIIFPGGYFLQDGQYKVFDGDYGEFEFHRAVRSPNGEDVLYVFHERRDGRYALFPYNLIRREVGTPIQCSGYSLFPDGKMVVFRYDSDEPTRVHPMQVWATPFVSDEHAAAAPDAAGFLGKVGNAELVRGISDCLSVRRFIIDQRPSRTVYEDLITNCTRIIDAYYWLSDQAEVGDLKSVLAEIRGTGELIVDEFEKVVAIKRQASEALAQAAEAQEKLIRGLRPDSWERV
ncbi:MAG: DNA repair ATPase, partial [Myxococcales bacterium]|nr:DNA repair ATPase [Myxococcales bacterium]